MIQTRVLIAIGGVLSVRLLAAPAGDTKQTSPTGVDDDGTLHIHTESIPYSDLASAEGKRNYVEYTRGFESLENSSDKDENIQEKRNRLDRLLMIPGLERLRKVFPVDIKPEKIGGVQTDIVIPAGGIALANKHRVLINLHGGGMQVGGRYGGQMESVPIASIGAIKVITVDYRMAPEWHFPAATEDVASVYVELLKSYRPENIGIYGCSAGAYLASHSTAWFQAHGLPRPGAIGLFGWGANVAEYGDSNYIFAGGRPYLSHDSIVNDPYFKGLDLSDPSVAPMHGSSVLRKFPPTLLIGGTRDIGLSSVVYTHSRLVDLGVKADLHVLEGAPHCSFAQPVVDPEVPENRQTWKVITRFFKENLGTGQK